MRRFNNIYQGSPDQDVLEVYNDASKLLNLTKALDRLMIKLNKSMLGEGNDIDFEKLLKEKRRWAKYCLDNNINDFIDSYKVYMSLVRQVYYIKWNYENVHKKLESAKCLNNLSKADELRITQTEKFLKEVLLSLERTPISENNAYDKGNGIRYVEYLNRLMQFYVDSNQTYSDLKRLVFDEVIMPLKYLDLITSLFTEDTVITFVVRTDYQQYSIMTCNLSDLQRKDNVISFGDNTLQFIKFYDCYFLYRSDVVFGEVIGFY